MGVETIIQGGAVGISVALIGLVWKVWSSSDKHVERMTDVVEKNASAMESLRGAIKENTEITKETKEMIIKINGKK